MEQCNLCKNLFEECNLFDARIKLEMKDGKKKDIDSVLCEKCLIALVKTKG